MDEGQTAVGETFQQENTTCIIGGCARNYPVLTDQDRLGALMHRVSKETLHDLLDHHDVALRLLMREQLDLDGRRQARRLVAALISCRLLLQSIGADPAPTTVEPAAPST